MTARRVVAAALLAALAYVLPGTPMAGFSHMGNAAIRAEIEGSSQFLGVAWTDASAMRSDGSSPKNAPLKTLLSQIDSARLQTKLGQAERPYATLSLDAGTWGEWRDPFTGAIAFTANNPRITLLSSTGRLEIPVDAARYLIDRDGGLQRYGLTVNSISHHGCLALEDIQDVFPRGELIKEVSHPPHGLLPPEERWNVEWRVGGPAGANDILSFWFDFTGESSLVTRTCLRRIAFGLSK